MKDFWEKFYNCDCNAETLGVHKDQDGFVDIGFFNQSIYSLHALTWKGRIRQIWQILKHGSLWCDMVTLRPETAKRLGEDLIKMSEEVK